ncbi:MAG: TIGR02281 family clan AA aspartic protease [Zoogloeaceae bacterium]|nr:TIGR02281 family clan AA aspartic protease [Rhodocyclaceae bacterium]MCP5235981.1 TIGR02281 family clan AA aspartic protease [Zoogloeaceae bacterium]
MTSPEADRPAVARAPLSLAAGALLWLASASVGAQAPDVVVAGTFPGKALLMIDGGAPRAVAVGQRTAEGVRVIAVEGDMVTFEVGGQRQSLRTGDRVAHVASGETGGELVLSADSGGHFRTQGRINGASVEFLVDTGATLVSIGRSDAMRAGIGHADGRRAVAQTANGSTSIRLVTVDALKIGGVTLHNVQAAVHEHDLPVSLLGMSALARFDLRHDGTRLHMRKRY